MIFSALFVVFGIVLGVIGVVMSTVTSLFTALVPDFLSDGITAGFAQLAIFKGVIPLVATPGAAGLAGTFGIVDLFGFGMTVMLALFTFWLILFILRHIPFADING